MCWRILVIALALFIAPIAPASPLVTGSVHIESVIGCINEDDAQGLAALAGANLGKEAQLRVWKGVEAKCDPYEGPFMVTKVIGHYGRLWVLEVTTFTDGDLYILYGEEDGRWSI